MKLALILAKPPTLPKLVCLSAKQVSSFFIHLDPHFAMSCGLCFAVSQSAGLYCAHQD